MTRRRIWRAPRSDNSHSGTRRPTIETNLRPPRDDLFRGLIGVPIHFKRDGDGEGEDGPILQGHFLVFNVWTEINSYWEGKFLERIAPGAAKKTIKERGDQIRCLFQHGYDPQVGDKPLGPYRELREDGDTGVYYEVPLLDTSYNRDLIPGLEAGVYGASFCFRVMREEIVEEPGESEHNPKGIPERTIKEIMLFEGGPVTFGAYSEATAGLRMCSLTDNFLLDKLAADPERLQKLVEAREARIASSTLPTDDAELEAHVGSGSRDDATPEEPAPEATPRKPAKDYLNPKEDGPPWRL